jgi:AP-1 complex subunit gamma-1
VETIIKILSLAGNFVDDEILSATAQLICGSPDVQPYAVHKLYSAFKDNMAQEGLVMLAVWCIGEFTPALTGASVEAEGETFLPVSASQVLDTLEVLSRRMLSQALNEYLLTALIKLTLKLPSVRPRVLSLIENHTRQLSLELQQRACECLQLLESPLNSRLDYILGSIPALKKDVQANMPLMSKVFTQDPVVSQATDPEPPVNSLLELDLIFDILPSAPSGPSGPGMMSQPAAPSIESALADIFNVSTPVMNVFDQPKPHVIPESASSPIPQPEPMHDNPEVVGFADHEISIIHRSSKPEEDMSVTQIETSIHNVSSSPITNFRLQVAVQKYMKVQLYPASGSSIAPGSCITQQIKVTNSQHGSKEIVLRLKIDYLIGGETRSKVTQSHPK